MSYETGIKEMAQEIFNRNKYDKAVTFTVFTTVAGTALLLAASLFTTFDKVWLFIFMSAGLSASVIAMLVKGAATGKRYMQGAKHRREKWFPMFFAKNESLADEAFKVWHEKGE